MAVLAGYAGATLGGLVTALLGVSSNRAILTVVLSGIATMLVVAWLIDRRR